MFFVTFEKIQYFTYIVERITIDWSLLIQSIILLLSLYKVPKIDYCISKLCPKLESMKVK